MEPPSQIILPYIEQSANIVYNEALHLLVNCTFLTNKRTILSYPSLHTAQQSTSAQRERGNQDEERSKTGGGGGTPSHLSCSQQRWRAYLKGKLGQQEHEVNSGAT